MENDSSFSRSMQKKVQIIDILISLILIGFSIYSLLNYNSIKSSVVSSVGNYGLAGLFLIIVFLEFVPSVLNPVIATWTGIISGYNVYLVLSLSILASLLGSSLGFAAGKKYGFKYVYLLFEEKTFKKINSFWNKNSRWFVAVAAVTPVPYVPLIFGALKMSWKDFTIYGIIPRIFNFIIFGYLFYFGIWGV
jgi:membrane protein DedA with SNARE-associated domain